MRRWLGPATAAALTAALLLPGGPRAGALPPPAGGELHAEVAAPDGSPVAEPTVELLSAAGAVALADRGAVGDGWRIVVLIDLSLSDPLALRNGALLLAERAPALVALGEVELVLADETVRTALPPTRDAGELADALAWIRLRESGGHLQAARRSQFAGREAPTRAAVESAVAAERERLGVHLDALADWAAAAARPGPQLLLWVSGGFDERPETYYSAFAEGLAAPLPVLGAAALGEVLSVYGWTVVPLRAASRGDGLAVRSEDEERSGMEQLEEAFEEQAGLSPAIGFDPRRRNEGEKESAPELLVAPLAPLTAVAEATGGEVVADPLQVDSVLERLPARRRLVLPAPSELGTGPLELAARGGGRVRARRWAASVQPPAVSAARMRRLLRDELEVGDFWVDALLEPASGAAGRLTVSLEPELAGRPLRATVGMPRPGGELQTVQFELTPGEAAGPAAEELLLPLDLDLPADVEYPVAVLVEDVGDGRRGAAFAALREAGGEAAAGPTPYVPSRRLVRLAEPSSPMLVGPTRFDALVAEDRVGRVEFRLDGELAGVRDAPPYSILVDLGSLPRTRRLEVAAFDSAGAELGRDAMIVNGGSGWLDVRIVEPEPRAPGERPRLRTGPVEVVADVRQPDGARLDRVEFYWNEELVATRYAAPFRESVVVPASDPRGFVRVVARLADGDLAEDVVFVNSAGPAERLDIDLIELYVVVTDRDGRPVSGLARDRFRVLEDGRPVEIATFGDARDLPLTVGLAIDSSASMFVKLPRVQSAASEFVRGLKRRRDRVFVVGFGGEPRLAHNPTSELPRALDALGRLRPDGQTAIWEAIVYSLVQLQGVPGKKALIVYSDGADEDPDFSYRTCLRFARLVGAPIYVILTNNEILRTGGKGLNVRGFLGRLRGLTEEVGGRVYLTRVGDDLESVYEEIGEELRSQYFVGYYSRQGDGTEWRRLEVDVVRPGLTARTISGFFR